MRVLGIDTAGSSLSVGLVDDRGVVGDYVVDGGRQRGSRLLPMLSALLSDAGHDLDGVEGIAVTSGPGSFTGVRIGLATAGAIAYARDIPLVLVTTLEALAWPAGQCCRHVAAMVRAGRGLVYGGRFEVDDDDVRLIGGIRHGDPARVAGELVAGRDSMMLVGPEWDAAAEAIAGRARIEPGPPGIDRVTGAAVAGLGRVRLLAGQRMDPFALEPVYVGRPGIGKGAGRS